MRSFAILSASVLALCSAGASGQTGAYVLDHAMSSIEGGETDLARYKGKVVVMVNVASRCGLTPQYEQLESVYRKYKDDGLVVLGFPANNFGGQEPGTNAEIQEFCAENYDVSFPMFAKISVAGEDKHPLYQELAGQGEPLGGDPRWNFTKFIVDREGRVAARFEPRTRPDAPEMIERIEALLASDSGNSIGGERSVTKGLWF